MKTAKLGAIFLVSVLALAGVGIGYAAWTDTLYIEGTVNTGSVGWEFTDYSGTWVYKDHDDDSCYVSSWNISEELMQQWNKELIAYAEAYEGIDDHHAIVVFDNLFPCIDFVADLEITYTGTVPGKINALGFYDLNTYPENYWPDDDDEIAIDQYTTIEIWVYDAAGYQIYYGVPYCGLQLHEGYTIYAEMTIHLPQDNSLMDLSGEFGVFAEVIQWNEYGLVG